jgi:dihydroorotase
MIVALDLIVRNGTVVTSGGRRDVDVGIRDGVFVAIEPRGELREPAADEIDASGLLVLPGLIDGHVHFREPGLEHEETWLTGTRAAVFGGVTTVLDMPNTVPPTATVEAAEQKLALASRSAYCDFGILGLLGESEEPVASLVASGLVVGLKCFLGPTTGGLAAPDDTDLRRVLGIAREAGIRVAFHAEDRELIDFAAQTATTHLESRPVAAEVAAIDRIARLLVETDAHGHVLHVTSGEGLAAIDSWRADAIDLTAEVTPHHALLDLDVYDEFGGLAKVNPPIRGGEHRVRLMAALEHGQIDVLGSDHAPHLLADKQRDSIADVAAGFAGVETLLPLMLTEVNVGNLTLERLVEATSERPAHIWGLWPRKGAVHVGSDADLTLVDLRREGTVRAADLHGMNNHSPFEGRSTTGAPVTTIVRGQIVVRDRKLVGQQGWGRPVVSTR